MAPSGLKRTAQELLPVRRDHQASSAHLCPCASSCTMHGGPHERACCCDHAAQVLVKGDERLADVISQYAKDSGADVVVVGSQNLCVDGEYLTGHSTHSLRIEQLVVLSQARPCRQHPDHTQLQAGQACMPQAPGGAKLDCCTQQLTEGRNWCRQDSCLETPMAAAACAAAVLRRHARRPAASLRLLRAAGCEERALLPGAGGEGKQQGTIRAGHQRSTGCVQPLQQPLLLSSSPHTLQLPAPLHVAAVTHHSAQAASMVYHLLDALLWAGVGAR